MQLSCSKVHSAVSEACNICVVSVLADTRHDNCGISVVATDASTHLTFNFWNSAGEEVTTSCRMVLQKAASGVLPGSFTALQYLLRKDADRKLPTSDFHPSMISAVLRCATPLARMCYKKPCNAHNMVL